MKDTKALLYALLLITPLVLVFTSAHFASQTVVGVCAQIVYHSTESTYKPDGLMTRDELGASTFRAVVAGLASIIWTIVALGIHFLVAPSLPEPDEKSSSPP